MVIQKGCCVKIYHPHELVRHFCIECYNVSADNNQEWPCTMQANSLTSLLVHQAQINPDELAFTHLSKSLKVTGTLTFHELYEKAAMVAIEIREYTKPGDRVLLLHQAGLQFVIDFFGSLLAGTIPVPAYPPNPRNLKASICRLNNITSDSKPNLVLYTSLVPVLSKHSILKIKLQEKSAALAKEQPILA